MPEDVSVSAASPSAASNGVLRKGQDAPENMPLSINSRLPRGRVLPSYAVEYFNQLVAQYLTLPLAATDAPKARAVALVEAIIKQQNRQPLNWGDVSGMEMALLQLLPKEELARYAWNLRARYHEVAGQGWYDSYQQSRPPDESAPAKATPPPTVSVANTPAGTLSSVFLLTPAAPEAAEAAPSGDEAATAGMRADLSILLGDLQRLRSTIQSREEKRSDISKWGALLALVSLLGALAVYAGPLIFSGHPAAKNGMPMLPPPLQILQTTVLVSLCGVMGGLISMLRRLQSLTPGSSPLIDTIALNAGQFGIGLSPVYGAIFAVVLYVVFLSGLLGTIISPTAQAAVFPQFVDAAPATHADYARLLVWAFVAGFAEKLVPDVLDRLTAKNTAASQAKAAAGGDPPPHPG